MEMMKPRLNSDSSGRECEVCGKRNSSRLLHKGTGNAVKPNPPPPPPPTPTRTSKTWRYEFYVALCAPNNCFGWLTLLSHNDVFSVDIALSFAIGQDILSSAFTWQCYISNVLASMGFVNSNPINWILVESPWRYATRCWCTSYQIVVSGDLQKWMLAVLTYDFKMLILCCYCDCVVNHSSRKWNCFQGFIEFRTKKRVQSLQIIVE